MKGAPRGIAAFTLGEILVASSMLGLMASMMFAILNISMNLSARNVAINLAHHEARLGMDLVMRDLHRAVSIPQLVDGTMTPVLTNGPSAGVTFQIIASGPFQVTNDPASAAMQLATSASNPVAPRVGDHIVVLDYPIETDVTEVTSPGSGSRWNIKLLNSSEKKVQAKNGSFIVCYMTRRVGYVVVGSDLRYYPNLIATPNSSAVVARNVSSATPFSIPLNDTGTPDTRYTNVNLIVSDPTYSQRNFGGTKVQMADAHVPYRYQLAQYQ